MTISPFRAFLPVDFSVHHDIHSTPRYYLNELRYGFRFYIGTNMLAVYAFRLDMFFLVARLPYVK